MSRTSGICKIAIAQRRTQNAEAILISQSIIMARNGLEIYNSLLNTVICPCVHQRALVHCSVQLRASARTSRADVYTSRAVACSRVHFACSRVQWRVRDICVTFTSSQKRYDSTPSRYPAAHNLSSNAFYTYSSTCMYNPT